MNERIKELYNQSLEEKYQYGGSDAKPGEMYSNYITVLNPEKFAQLIVRECAGIYDKIDNGNLHMGTDDYLEALDKTFFGVDE